MLKCNLPILLTKRRLKITKISNDTGISRTTLTSLAYNYAQGIQFETLNTLCMYLQITPQQFFSYVPISINVADINISGVNADGEIIFKVKDRSFTKEYYMKCSVYIYDSDGNVTVHDPKRHDRLIVKITCYENDDEYYEKSYTFQNRLSLTENNVGVFTALDAIDEDFLLDLSNMIIKKVKGIDIKDYDEDCTSKSNGGLERSFEYVYYPPEEEYNE